MTRFEEPGSSKKEKANHGGGGTAAGGGVLFRRGAAPERAGDRFQKTFAILVIFLHASRLLIVDR